MAIKLDNNKFQCMYCEKEHNTANEANTCRTNHNLIYIPLAQDDLSRLLQFIYTKNDALITRRLMLILTKYLRGVAKEDVMSSVFESDK